MPGAHAHSNNYLAAGAYQEHVNSARNCVLGVADANGGNTWYSIWYVRLDDNTWPMTPGAHPNYKCWDFESSVGNYLGENHFYEGCTSCVHNRVDPASIGFNTNICGENDADAAAPSEINQWVHQEVIFRNNEALIRDTKFDGTSPPVRMHDRSCSGAALSWTPRTFFFGGFNRHDADDVGGYTHSGMWRYFDDLYVDTTWSRVILANNQNYEQATIVEPQIPSAWSDDSITVTANLGALPDTGTAYLFVFDQDNSHNGVGYPVTLGGGTGQLCPDGTCNGTETCHDCPEDCLQAGEACCNGVAYSITTQVCCSGSIYTGDCCVDGNCTSPETCVNYVCTPPCENDHDGDGYGIGANCLGPDCDDNNPNVHENITCSYNGFQCGSFSLCLETCPTSPAEICDNSQDDDCDNQIDCQDSDCSSNPNCAVPVNCTELNLLMHFDNQAEYGENLTSVYDFSGNGNNGTVYGATQNPSAGRFGGAFEFDGDSDYITINNDPSLDMTDGITLAAWVYPTAITDWDYIISRAVSSPGPPYIIYALGFSSDTQRLRMRVFTDSGYDVLSPVINPDQWYHVAGTYSASDNNLTIYINGELAGSTDASGLISVNNKGVLIGGYEYQSTETWNGLIDEVAVWSRSLSPQEIQDIYTSSSPISCKTYHPADTNQDGCITLDELLAFINRWKISSKDVTMPELMEAIGLWKSGTGC